MRRTGFDERRDQQVANECAAEYLPCRVCGQATERETMSTYGAQCAGCFGRYVLGGKLARTEPMTRGERESVARRLKASVARMQSMPGRSWAEALRNREQSGESLSMAQRQAWRSALGDESAA